jgi:hypothetical protein
MTGGSILGLAAHQGTPLGQIPTFQWAVLATCLAILTGLWWARDANRPRLFTAIGLALALPMFPFLAYAAMRWNALGRPFEVFTRLHVTLLAVPLMAWRSFSTGVVLLAAFTVEGVIIYALELQTGTRARMPLAEPAASLVFAAGGLTLLILCERRRRLAERYLRTEAEAQTLGRVAFALENVGQDLAASLTGLDALLDRAAIALGGALTDAMRGAAEQLVVVRKKLAALGDAAGEPEVTLAGDAPLQPSERALFARDAHTSMLICASFVSIASGLVLLRFVYSFDQFPLAVRANLALLGFGLLATIDLLRTRRRPSSPRSLFWFVALIAVSLPMVTVTTGDLRRGPISFEPFLAIKVEMAILPIVLTRQFRLGIVLEATLAATMVVLFRFLHLGELRERIPQVEPWEAFLFLVIGIGLLQRREQRQMASVLALRAEKRRAALARRARLYLALGDQINTPVQVLLLGLGEAEARGAAAAGAAAERLNAVSKKLPVVDELLRANLSPGVSLDGARELLRQA